MTPWFLGAVLTLIFAACSGPAPSFTLSLSPTNLTVQQGGSGSTTLTVTPQNGFTGAVSLAVVDGSGNPVSGITLSPASVSVSSSAAANQSLTVSVASSVAPGTYTLQVRGTAGSLTQQANLSLTVSAPPPPPSFTLSLSPTSLTVQQGGSGNTTLTVTPQNGFTGAVSLALVDSSGNPVSGIALSPTSVSVSGSAAVNQSLTVSVASNVPPGTYNLQVRGTAGSLTQQASLSLTVSGPGSTWTARTSGTSYDLYGVAYGGGSFVAVGEIGSIRTSTDGVSWTARTSGTVSHLRGVTYGGSSFVAVGEAGTILTSP